MRRYSRRLLLPLFLLAAGAGRAGEEAGLFLPETEIVLVLKRLGGSLDHCAEFASRVVPNSGAVLRQGLAAHLFLLPLHRGLDPERPAALWWRLRPDPRYACLLPVADAAEFQASARESLGADTAGEVWRIELLPPAGAPPKKIFILLQDSWALAATDEALLEDLRAFRRERPTAVWAPAEAPDLRLALEAGLFFKPYLSQARLYLPLGLALLGARFPEYRQLLSELPVKIFAFFQQISRLELNVDFTGELRLTARAVSRPGSALEAFWRGSGRAPDWTAPGLLPADAPLALGGSFESLKRLSREELAAALLLLLPARGEAWQGAAGRLAEAGAGLLAGARGDWAAALRGAPASGVQGWLALSAAEPDKLAANLEKLVPLLFETAAAAYREILALPPEAAPPMLLERLRDASVPTWRLEVLPPSLLAEVMRRKLDDLIGWPLLARLQLDKAGIALCAGRRAADLGAAAAPARNLAEDGIAPPPGAFFWCRTRPSALLRLGTDSLIDPTGELGGNLTRDLPALPLDLFCCAREGALEARLELASGHFRQLWQLYRRAEAAGLLRRRLKERAEAPPEP